MSQCDEKPSEGDSHEPDWEALRRRALDLLQSKYRGAWQHDDYENMTQTALLNVIKTYQRMRGTDHIVKALDTDALKAFPHREAMLAEFARRSPAGRVLAPADVAGAVYLLSLPEADMVSGHTLVVDGGYSVSS